MPEDTRNVTDEYRGMSVDEIRADLDSKRHTLQIAVENLERDFNMGTIVRNANAFNVSVVHVIGRRQWNKRGAMSTNLYMNVQYHATIADFLEAVDGYTVIGIDNVENSMPLHEAELPERCVMVFGSEGPGLSDEMINVCSSVVAIEQFGSTRSVNVGVASGIAMYAWIQRHILGQA